MNGKFWGHMAKAIGLAIVGNGVGNEQENEVEAAPTRTTRRSDKNCCTAKRPSRQVLKMPPVQKAAEE